MLRHRLTVLASALCFSTTGTAQALGPDAASPVVVGASRVAVGALGLLAVTWWMQRRADRAGGTAPPGSTDGRTLVARLGLPTGPGVRGAVWRAGLAVAAYQVGFFLAVRTTGVAVGTVVALGSAPVLTGAAGWLLGHGRPDRRWVVATALACGGLAVLVTGGASAHVAPVGVLLALVAAAAYAAYTVAAKALLAAGVGAESAMAAVFGAGAVWLLPAFAVAPVGWVTTPRGAALVLWLGLVPTTLAYVLFARGLTHLSAAETTTLVLAEPLAAACLGIGLLGEPVGRTTLVGGGLLVTGLVAVAVRRSAAPGPATAAPGTTGTGPSGALA
ncbi:DMT family transporter [Kineosporia sp. R_H_3]|uniref:DMT family transporter n=1 Tax=Kineosporia sp. R_H_3 TaxID=1961848 RepID=UPI000B4B9DA3|nr:EamA family transporter [Kineosporia sp. R_H_3]